MDECAYCALMVILKHLQQKRSPDLARRSSLDDPPSANIEPRRSSQPAVFPASSSAPAQSTLLLHSASLEQSMRGPFKVDSSQINPYAIQLQRYQQYLKLHQNKIPSFPGYTHEPSSAGV
jgi:hypothetical protein